MIRSVRIYYVDESGNTGDVAKSGATRFYALGVVCVDVDVWGSAFDHTLAVRRELRDRYGVPIRAEIKANSLVHNGGDLRRLGLSYADRRAICVRLMRAVSESGMKAFSVLVDKEIVPSSEAFDIVWLMALQRMERDTRASQDPFLIVHDNGENDAVRKVVRKARRHLTASSRFGSGSFTYTVDRLVEDPVPRDSRQSFFLQYADLVAYAAWRTLAPPGGAVARTIPRDLWSELGSAINPNVNRLSGGAPGVAEWRPRRAAPRGNRGAGSA